MASVNKAIIVGHLGQKPEVKFLPSGQAVCNFTVATNDQWKDKDGEKKERVEWHRITCWGKLAENCAKYLDKGRAVYIEGRLQTREYEKEGQKHWTTEIIAQQVQFLGEGKGGRRDDAPPPSEEDFELPKGDGTDIPF